MKTYIMMTKIAPHDAHLIEVTHKLQDHNKNAAAWLQEVKELCPEVNVLAHYAILGPYDFMCIYEAPDEVTAAKISLLSRSKGAFQVESWNAIPTKELEDVLDSVLTNTQ
ncbi:MAG: GYD domain-containing protein [Calditrichaeota bacterium]|nr:MAG: GYD domain-containing protein [Calditrichota bacterium]